MNNKFQKNDIVQFIYGDETLTGTIKIVDAYGTFEQTVEPSYDIMVFDYNESGECFFKHILESDVIGPAQ